MSTGADGPSRIRRAKRALIGELMELVAAGSLHPVHPATHPLEDAAAVMTGLIDRSIAGKAVLVP